MKFNNIELEVGQEWRTKLDSKFHGTRVVIVKVEEDTVQCKIDNMLFDENAIYTIEESEVSHLLSIA